MLGPTLETERLILRPPTAEDFEPFCAFMALEATHFIGGPLVRPTAWRMLSTYIGGWTLNGFSFFSYIDKASGEWVGRGGPWMPEGWPGKEVGWGLIPEYQGKGYAKEASVCAIDWVFDALGWEDVIHCIDRDNSASISLALSLGSALQRTDVAAPPPFADHSWDVYGQSRETWRARKR